MMKYTKYLAIAAGLLLSTNLFSADSTIENPGISQGSSARSSATKAVSQEMIDAGNTLYVMKNPHIKHTEEDLASYRRYLTAEIQPEKPENVPAEAFYSKDNYWILLKGAKIIDSWNQDGTSYLAASVQPEKPANIPAEAFYSDKKYNAWIITKEGSVIDAWNLDGTLYQPLYAWWVYFNSNSAVTAATHYNQFIEAYKAKFFGVSVDEETFKSVVAPYQNVSTVFPKSGITYQKITSSDSSMGAIDSFLDDFMSKVVSPAVPISAAAAYDEPADEFVDLLRNFKKLT